MVEAMAKTTSEFEKIAFDKTDPNYRKAVWRYILDHQKG
jgi:hypothetical protein